jgi:hypothetical protein
MKVAIELLDRNRAVLKKRPAIDERGVRIFSQTLGLTNPIQDQECSEVVRCLEVDAELPDEVG